MIEKITSMLIKKYPIKNILHTKIYLLAKKNLRIKKNFLVGDIFFGIKKRLIQINFLSKIKKFIKIF